MESCMLHKDNSRVETGMKATTCYEFDAFGATGNAAFFYFCFWGPVIFFVS